MEGKMWVKLIGESSCINYKIFSALVSKFPKFNNYKWALHDLLIFYTEDRTNNNFLNFQIHLNL